MVSDIKLGKAEDELHEVVSQQGQAQYPLTIVAAAWSLFLMMKRRERRLRAISGAALTLALTSLGFAFYRGYFTSLGT